ncbi:MAG TPA: hypothetical protein ENN41_10790 [Sediminispirochaeta sp.]|nr:hypothetical protein [Sediminispirochaeta sp.]
MDGFLETIERTSLPDREEYLELLRRVSEVLLSERPEYRPRDAENRPGGLLRLPDLPTVIVPDLHARRWVLDRLLGMNWGDESVESLLRRGAIQVVCVGDGFHAEGRAAGRWRRAFREYVDKYKHHQAMDEEMRESLGLMEMVMNLKIAFPEHFHFLKGNHENISNEEGRGNHPFRKYAYEGEMVRLWVLQFYGRDFLEAYAEFEHLLPLLAAASDFIVSHAEPRRFFSAQELVEYRSHDEVVEGLTWTGDGESEEGSVRRMLDVYCDSDRVSTYFGGHRPVSGSHNLRADGNYVQIHNPEDSLIVLLSPGLPFAPNRDIIEL